LFCAEDVKTETEIIPKPARKKAIEDDMRIVANIRRGEAELKAGLGKRFTNADDFIEHLANLTSFHEES
jgi:hypothetical protein